MEDPDNQQKDLRKTYLRFLNHLKSKVVAVANSTSKSTLDQNKSQTCFDIEGSLIGLENGLQGESKEKLEKQVDVQVYVMKNLKYFEEQETLRK